MEQKIIQPPTETATVSPSPTTPAPLSAREQAEAFYGRVIERRDMRELLSRLAKK